MIMFDSFRPQGAADLSNNPLASPEPTVPSRPLPPLLLALYKHLLSAYYASRGPEVERKADRSTLSASPRSLLSPESAFSAQTFCKPPPFPHCQASWAVAISSPCRKRKAEKHRLVKGGCEGEGRKGRRKGKGW